MLLRGCHSVSFSPANCFLRQARACSREAVGEHPRQVVCLAINACYWCQKAVWGIVTHTKLHLMVEYRPLF